MTIILKNTQIINMSSKSLKINKEWFLRKRKFFFEFEKSSIIDLSEGLIAMGGREGEIKIIKEGDIVDRNKFHFVSAIIIIYFCLKQYLI